MAPSSSISLASTMSTKANRRRLSHPAPRRRQRPAPRRADCGLRDQASRVRCDGHTNYVPRYLLARAVNARSSRQQPRAFSTAPPGAGACRLSPTMTTVSHVADECFDILVLGGKRCRHADSATGRDANPSNVHPICHNRRHCHLDIIHLCEPSPQRTPVSYLAR